MKRPNYQRRGNALSPKSQEIARRIILRELESHGLLALACQKAGISRGAAYRWRREDPDFDSACRAAVEQAAEQIEYEAYRRGVEGVAEPIIYRGEVMTDRDGKPLTVTRYSDKLLALLLVGARPEKYGRSAQAPVTDVLRAGFESGISRVSPERQAMLARLARMVRGLSKQVAQIPSPDMT